MKKASQFQQENQTLREELRYLEEHKVNLEQILSQVTSAKAFKLWQTLVGLRCVLML